MPITKNSTSFKASCHCGAFNKSLTIPIAAFPLKSSICHCQSCRHVTGQLFATFAVIPGPLPDASWFTQLAKYSSSKTLDRYFCPICGASVLNIDRGAGAAEIEWEFATGVLEFEARKDDGGSLDGRLNRVIIWVEDCKDGGAVHWINEGRIEGLGGRFMGGRGSQTILREHVASFSQVCDAEQREKGELEELKGRCHCGRVAIKVLPPAPDASPKDCSAEFCACTSCRKTSGFEVAAWTHIKRDKVLTVDGEPYQNKLSHLGLYESSQSVNRYFCNTCGATVFYDRTDLTRIDVALGLFDAPEGSRAEQWFTWNPDHEDIAFLLEAIDKEFVGGLANGVGSTTRKDGVSRVVTSF